MVYQHGQGLSQGGHFADKRAGGQFFAILCGRLFRMVPIKSCILSAINFATNLLLNANLRFSNYFIAVNIVYRYTVNSISKRVQMVQEGS